MTTTIDRREFLAATTTVAATLSAGLWSRAQAAEAASPAYKTKIQKAVIVNKPTEDGLKKLKDAGYDGVEGGVISVAEAEKCRAIADQLGMKIHSVLYGWAEFNSSDPAKVDATFKKAEDALRAGQAFGADAVLLVPCRIGGMKMPLPWEFLIDFDEKTGHIRTVAPGDNAPYAAYIKAHNHATDTSTAAIKRLIPLAEKTKVVIALENVGNNLWVQPKIFRHFVQSFQSPWVKAYFDIGNHVRFAPPEEWILTLNTLIARIHVKDYLLDPADPNGRGTSVNLREGSVRWPVVRQAIEAINYNGWMTIESNGSISFEERSRRLDLILAGQ